jgi:hypothetical protein
MHAILLFVTLQLSFIGANILNLQLLLVSTPLNILLARSSQRGFDPPLNIIRFLLLLLLFGGRISDDQRRSNQVLGDVSDEASILLLTSCYYQTPTQCTHDYHPTKHREVGSIHHWLLSKGRSAPPSANIWKTVNLPCRITSIIGVALANGVTL